jgi:hypothetical protein
MNNRFRIALNLLAGILFLGAPMSRGDSSDTQSLGPVFTSRAGGISLRPIAGGKTERKHTIGSGVPIVRFFNEKEQWTLKVVPIMYDSPVNLKTVVLPGDRKQIGLLEEIERQTREANLNTQILRSDHINIGPNDAGILISRYTSNLQTWLRQQAIVKAHSRQYYVVDLTTPSDWNSSLKPDQIPASEQIAAELFDQVLRTIRIFDTSDIFTELNRRLDAGMTESINFARRLEKNHIPQQYYRVISTATATPRDIGWLVIHEDREVVYEDKPGLRVFIITQTQGADQEVLRSFSDFFATNKRSSPDESWVINQFSGDQNTLTELGETHLRRIPKVITNTPADPRLSVETNLVSIDKYFLNVTQKTPLNPFQPVERELAQPFFYLPLAWNVCLPRLLPLDEVRGYAFACWITSEQSIIWRYIDVDGQKQSTFNGVQGRYSIVRDRIGYDGDDTFHYFDNKGRYLGWETPSQKLRWVAVDEASMLRTNPTDNWSPRKLLDGTSILSTIDAPSPASSNNSAAPGNIGR